MKLQIQYPFLDFDSAYLIFHKKMMRYQVCLVSKEKRKTILYSKFLMSIKEQRILGKEEEVDHIDNNCLNDSIENLQILTKKENKDKQSLSCSKKITELQCCFCNKKFDRETRNIKQNQNQFCSRSCMGLYRSK